MQRNECLLAAKLLKTCNVAAAFASAGGATSHGVAVEKEKFSYKAENAHRVLADDGQALGPRVTAASARASARRSGLSVYNAGP